LLPVGAGGVRCRPFSDAPGSGFEKTHRFFSEGIPNIRYIEHNSRTYDFSKLGERFDLIFVDGDHTCEGVRSDTANVFNLLRDENSVIVWHDYAFIPELVRWFGAGGDPGRLPAGRSRQAVPRVEHDVRHLHRAPAEGVLRPLPARSRQGVLGVDACPPGGRSAARVSRAGAGE
jgi:hypothetical protein